MGLDMYVSKIKRLSADDVSIQRYRGTKPWLGTDMFYLAVSDCEENVQMFKDILPYLTKENICTSNMRYDLIKRDNNIPEEARNFFFSSLNDYIKLGFSYDKKTWEVVLSEKEIELYTEQILAPYYIANSYEMAYWRKEYDLQEKMYKLYERSLRLRKIILNCKEFKETDTGNSGAINNVQKEVKRLVESVPQLNNMTVSEIKDALQQINQLGSSFFDSDMPVSIENCGYYRMSREMAKAAGLLEEYNSLKKDEILAYHEWY